MLSSTIYKIFARSPISPMQQHMEKIHHCVSLLEPFFKEVLAQNWDKVEEYHKQILVAESDADELKKQIRLHLPNSLFMPVARTDLLGLLTSQDKIASKVKHISGLVFTRKMTFPEQIAQGMESFIMRSIDASRVAKKAINELDELIEAGFKGREVEVVAEMVQKIDEIERDTDTMQVEMRQQVFNIEGELNPVAVIFLYKVIDWVGELADRAQHVGHRIETLLAQ